MKLREKKTCKYIRLNLKDYRCIFTKKLLNWNIKLIYNLLWFGLLY